METYNDNRKEVKDAEQDVVLGRKGWASLSRAYLDNGMDVEANYAKEMHTIMEAEARRSSYGLRNSSVEYRAAVSLFEKEMDCTDENVLRLSSLLAVSSHLLLRLAKEEWNSLEAGESVDTNYANDCEEFNRLVSGWLSERHVLGDDSEAPLRRE